jgi:hypothetical protein
MNRHVPRRSAVWFSCVSLAVIVAAIPALAAPKGSGTGDGRRKKPTTTTKAPPPSTTPAPTTTVAPPTTVAPTTTTTTAPPAVPSAGSAYAPPAAIASDCSVDVTAALTGWIASVPNGSATAPSILSFPAARCYRIDDKVVITDRRNLRFDGNGSTFKAVTPGHSDRKQWQVYGGTNIAFADMTVEGVNYDAVDGAYNPQTEWQHLFNFWGTQGAVVEDVVGRWAFGDFVAFEADYRQPVEVMPPVRNAVVRNSTFVGAGRMGVSTNYVDGMVIENNSFDRVMWSVIDLEVEYHTWSVTNVTISNNTIGDHRHSFVANHGADRPVDNVHVVGNVMTKLPGSNQPSIHIIGATVPRVGWVIEGNTFRSYGWILHARGVRDVIVRNNIAHTGQNDAVAVEAIDTDNGVVTGNDFSGYTTVLLRDAASNSWSACGNRLTPTGPYAHPAPC